MRIRSLQLTNCKSFADSGELELGNINVLVGPNNSGKSTIIKGIYAIQGHSDLNVGFIRAGERQGTVTFVLSDFLPERHYAPWARNWSVRPVEETEARLSIHLARELPSNILRSRFYLEFANRGDNVGEIAPSEPENFIYPYLSKRKVAHFDQQVDRPRTLGVPNTLQNLVSKVARLANVDHEAADDYTDLCRQVLGFRISTIPSDGGQQAGIPIGRFGSIPLESMGEGVASLLGLIVDLCVADGNLFLLEEPENDIHPTGLKALLEVIVAKSASNQFVVSTHSNIVAKYLGAAPGAKIFHINGEYERGQIPTSTVHEVGTSAADRLAILRTLGYELYDFDLWEGWLILEESSAERLIVDYLIPWFVPRLSRVRTVAARGTAQVEPTFNDYHRLFLFTHLEERYRDAAWVIVDGDPSGTAVVQKLQDKFGASWPRDHFRTWTQDDFERFYPAKFTDEIDRVLAMQHGRHKQDAKKGLGEQVRQWCDDCPEEAKDALRESAAEVIALLEEIDGKLFSTKNR